MLKNTVLFLLAIIAAFLFEIAQTKNRFWFFLTPAYLLMTIYFFMNAGPVFYKSFFSLTLLLIVFSALKAHTFLYIPTIFVAAAMFLLVYNYERKWHQKLIETETAKLKTANEKSALEERFEVRMESLSHLERQVSGLVKLFEMARDFNECLSFSSLNITIDQKIALELGFASGFVLLIDSTEQTVSKTDQIFSFGPAKRDADEKLSRFADFCFNQVNETKEILKIENYSNPLVNEIQDFSPKLPLWVFPLMIEHRLIALLAVEGGAISDFPKFEIFASQLALQIKKIRLYETVKEISILDGLTGVFVRRHFLERFQEELRRAARYKFPLSVLMVDVDHFKSYNDKYGHLVGDKALREVALLIRDNIRRVDVLGRYGGEEFVVVAPEIDKFKGLELAERIRSAIARKRFRLYDEETQITVSIGVSSFPEDLTDKNSERNELIDSDISNLIDKADQALYRAKEEGRNRVVAYH